MTARLRLAAIALVGVAVAASCATPPVEHADLVLRNGTIVTVDDLIPEVDALAVRGDRIVAVGRAAELDRYIGDETQVIDLDGRLAIPGFIEGHGHFLGIGDATLQLDLRGATSWADVVALVEDAAARARPGELIRGRGWHQDKWDPPPSPSVEGLPLHDALSAVSPVNPVLLRHASGHATLANQKAMELAGITADTPDPSGGEIVRDAAGNAIGAFRETAAGLLSAARRDATPGVPRRRAELAVRELLENGITSFQDAGASFAAVDLYKDMVEDGSLGVRLWVMLRASNTQLAARLADYRIIGFGDDRLTVRAIKHQIDGALGSHGAWLLEPYADLSDSAGLNTTPIETIEETARLALEHGFQLCVHAIGDRANRETLDLFERAFRATLGAQDLRWRIEHAQHLHPDDIPRFAELGVIASMQGKHATSDGSWVPDRLGDRRSEEGAYVWQRLLAAGAVVSNGTDAPVENVSPVASYYATVSRKLDDGSLFYPDQRLSRLDALRTYTINAAYAAFEEDLKGSLTPGKLADITVLSKNILTVPEEEIPSTEVVYTIVGGRVMYQR
ncbi:MAG: amidohydrolase [Vicinamibacterales bacterium]|nr:amidohydrolase [Vicinamibacterales bacterium]HIN11238.1 amidohydrolase [Acidobacteriota bacterium]